MCDDARCGIRLDTRGCFSGGVTCRACSVHSACRWLNSGYLSGSDVYSGTNTYLCS